MIRPSLHSLSRGPFAVAAFFIFVSASVLIGAEAPAARPSTGSTTQPSKISEPEQIQFQQKNASAQMQELQERMYRLAELTREAEPDDSARLILAVKKAREQLIIEQMKDLTDLLGNKDLDKAFDNEKVVLAKLEELKQLLLATDLDLQMQLDRLRKLQQVIAKLDNAIKEEKRQHGQSGQLAEQQKKGNLEPAPFNALKLDQQQNRQATDNIAQMTKDLGPAAAKAGQGLGTASTAMSKAEASLGGQKASDAQSSQADALKQMQQARNQLEQERQKVLEELQKQVRKQVMENLADMLDRQQSIRQATEAIANRRNDSQREVLLRLKQLSNAEQRLVNIADQTVTLIEETEFSITLPPAIRNVQRRCVLITAALNDGKGDPQVIASEKQVEQDLADLLETLKDPNIVSKGQGSGCKSCKGNKNKLLAELRVLRMLEIRVKQETTVTDASRAAAVAQLAPEMREKIGTIKDSQQQVQDATDRLHRAVTGE